MTNTIRLGFRGFALLSVMCISTIAANAAILGTFNINGSASVSLTTIDFLPLLVGPGDVQIVTPSTGSFSGLVGTTGTMRDLNSATEPVGSPLSFTNFVVLAGLPNMSLTLTFIQPGSFSSAQCGATPAAGQVCTPTLPPGLGLSPFNLINNTATSSTASFSVLVQALDTNTGEVTTGTGTFTTPFSSNNYQQLLATLATPGGAVSSSFSANFNLNTLVPEPATMTMGILGLGLIALGVIRKKRA